MLKVVLIAAFAAALPATSHAASFTLGQDAKVAIEIPDSWEPRQEQEQDWILASSEAGTNIAYQALAVSDAKAAEATLLGELETVEFIAEPSTRTEMGDLTINGMACHGFSYDGLQHGDSASLVSFACRPDEKSIVTLSAIFVGPSQKADDAAFQAILDSMKPVE